MKTSKLLLLTFAGLFFCIMTVTLDLNNRGQNFSIKELPAATKSCLQKYFPNNDIAYAKIKDDFVKTPYEMGKSKSYGQNFYDDGMLTYYDY